MSEQFLPYKHPALSFASEALVSQRQTIGLLALLDKYPSGYAKLFRQRENAACRGSTWSKKN